MILNASDGFSTSPVSEFDTSFGFVFRVQTNNICFSMNPCGRRALDLERQLLEEEVWQKPSMSESFRRWVAHGYSCQDKASEFLDFTTFREV